MAGRKRTRICRRGQRGSGIAGDLVKALAPVAKEVAMETGKYGARKLVNKLKIGGRNKSSGGTGRRERKRAGKRKSRPQTGGAVPLAAALIPAAIAVGKAAGLGGISAGASYGIKKLLKKISKYREVPSYS